MLDIFTREYFGNTVQQYLLFFGIVIGFWVSGKILYYLVNYVFKKATIKTKTIIDDIVIISISKPILFIILIFGLYLGSFVLTLPESLRIGYDTFLRILLEVSFAWVILTFIDAVIVEYLTPLTKKTESDLDDHLLPFVRTIVKTGILVIVVIMMLSDLGFNVTAIIAGLGIGGLAIGLAAKDFASNLFGGVVLIMDKPFTVGDKITIVNETGIVRHITLRFTELEVDDKTKKIIPNLKFIGNPIHNHSFKYKK